MCRFLHPQPIDSLEQHLHVIMSSGIRKCQRELQTRCGCKSEILDEDGMHGAGDDTVHNNMMYVYH